MATAIPAGINFEGPIVPFKLLAKQKISLGAKNVFVLIAAFRRNGRRCFAKTTWFAEQLGISESSARNYIRSLIETGLIFFHSAYFLPDFCCVLKHVKLIGICSIRFHKAI